MSVRDPLMAGLGRPAASWRHGMRAGEAVRLALQGLLSNKLRSLLTMLGIIIGVGSVIAMMAIGAGANQAARASLQAMGTGCPLGGC